MHDITGAASETRSPASVVIIPSELGIHHDEFTSRYRLFGGSMWLQIVLGHE